MSISPVCRLVLMLAVLGPLAACGHGVRLSDTERVKLRKEPVIHVLHYETALPAIKPDGRTKLPTPHQLRRAAGAEPAALIATNLSRLLGRKEKLHNLKLEARHLPRPVPDSALDHRPKYHRGLALELWVDRWSFEPVAGGPGQYAMQLGARTRLSRIEDGQPLWSTGECRVGGANNRDYRLAAGDLGHALRVRKLLAAARNECVRQLARDFDARDRTGKK